MNTNRYIFHYYNSLIKFTVKKWRKKHIKKLQSVRDERQRRRETLHKTIDEWRTEWIAKELALKRVIISHISNDN